MNTSIDSLKLRIPLSEIDLLDLGIKEHWVEVSESGEVDISTYKQKRLVFKNKGITTSFAIQKPNIAIPEESILILFNSKILKGRYLEGITPNNIKQVYKEIMALNVFFTSYESFLSGYCTDIDIKKDVVLNGGLELQQETIKSLAKISKASKQKRAGYDIKNSANNIGIQWSKREVATPSKPYLKVYAKDIELINKSNIFFHEYLKQVPEGLTRIEGTIKNKKHFNYITGDKNDLTLKALINLEQSQLENIIKSMASKHLEGEEIQGERGNEWTLAKAFCLAYLNYQNSMAMAKHDISKYTSDRKQTYRARVLIDQVWNDEFEGTDKGQRGAELDKVFEALGIGGQKS